MAREKTMDQEEQLIYTKYEKARMIGSRALQLSMGAPFLVKLSQEELKKLHFDPMEFACGKNEQGFFPLTLRIP